MDSDTKPRTHPSFVELIKQLTPLEARILVTYKLGERDIPVMWHRLTVDDPNLRKAGPSFSPVFGLCKNFRHTILSGYDLTKNIILPHDNIGGDIPSRALAVDNLIRLGLCQDDYSKVLTSMMEEYQQLSQFGSDMFRTNPTPPDGYISVFSPGVLYATEYGKWFYRACFIGHDQMVSGVAEPLTPQNPKPD